MFTGIITAIGQIESLKKINPQSDDLCLRVKIAAGIDLTATAIGDSIAVSGVCLTVTAIDGQVFQADVSNETLRCTTLGSKRAGDSVNLEAALKAGDPLGGHMVSGHVDGLAVLLETDADDSSTRMLFSLPTALAALVAAKGSITIDGVSLTVNSLGNLVVGNSAEQSFSVNLIPHTLEHTTLGGLQPGDALNLEIDMLARYIARQLELQQR
ncbi:MAG: riboflavin synthase [Xanthomonadales bacterium]|nr:riboflavin synthase [Xanthomonadales bacterium]